MTYSFDPELAPWAAIVPTANYDDPAAARAEARTMFAQMPVYQPPQPLTIENVTVPGPDGAPKVLVRAHAPADRAGLRASLLYLHGGGLVVGDLDTAHAAAAQIAAEVGVVVISVDFRLAPEHPFPAALEDCYAALVWAADKATDPGIDTGRLGVGGEVLARTSPRV